uniref:Glycosyltransferase n=1 Tax=uncultured Thiotrichaceae bacterium TaxID=298394 RepID=A0A6S6UAM7_9GAMM|nr:MAG: Unknown protein [uncultured Thiotrichaceae bacterium]
MKGAVAVFVKTPGLSPVKTRLGATIGHQLAEQFFHLAKAANEAMLTQAQQVFAEQGIELSCYWAVGEVIGVEHPMWLSDTMQRMHTGEGGLGERMHHVYSTLLEQHDFVVLMGIDSPQNSVENLLDAAEFLVQADSVVIGPALDGGFCVFGGNVMVELARWTAVDYSREDTLKNFLLQLSDRPVNYLGAMTDVDTESDLYRMVDEMEGELSPEQLALVSFVDRL